MWIQKLPVEAGSQNQFRLLCRTCLDVVLAVSLWYGLVRLSSFLGLPYHAAASSGVACVVAIIVLPASWFACRKPRQKIADHRRDLSMKTEVQLHDAPEVVS